MAMQNMNAQTEKAAEISAFLSKTEPLLERAGVSARESFELYDMYDAAARSAAANITEIDPELRVEICDRKDRILDRIVDLTPRISYEKHSIFTLALHGEGCRRWSNADLLKDCGLTGYTLAKETGASPVMCYGTQPSDYPYLSYMPGMEMLYDGSSTDMAHVYYELLNDSYTKMDTLILYGMHLKTPRFLGAYRKLRPDGKVYCGLDMNSFWMKKITWDSEYVKKFAKQCDVIATSCRTIRDALNRSPKVNFPCCWIANGFFNATGSHIIADPAKKDNIILSVGRISKGVKNIAELLNAFALISNIMPDWKIRLVGPVNQKFQSYMDSFFNTRPDLKNRVILTGEIIDKEELYKEYARAKIYALTSVTEGGTPNVYAEALHHGCMFVTSDIDGADDITNFGALGIKYKKGDFRALAGALVRMSQKADISAFQKHIPLALAYAAEHYDWNRTAKKIAFMLYKN